MIILAIETSCDETAVAVIKVKEGNNPSFQILSDIVFSQIVKHRPYGGVVPNLAATLHLENIIPAISKAQEEAKVSSQDVDLIAVTSGPGLIPALLVGVSTAQALAWLWQKPLIGLNHLEAHLLVNWLKIKNKKIFPALGLIVSGGHTQLILMKNFFSYKLIGQTRDDAAGEAFDKIARMLGLPYPGGPAIAKTAAGFRKRKSQIILPRPLIASQDFDFSFSGLKTAVSLMVKERGKKLSLGDKQELAFAVQEAVIDVLTKKTFSAIKKFAAKTLILSGGVVANQRLRQSFIQTAEQEKIRLILPEARYCTDNAVMIGVASYFQTKRKRNFSWKKIKAQANQKFTF